MREAGYTAISKVCPRGEPARFLLDIPNISTETSPENADILRQRQPLPIRPFLRTEQARIKT
jgi:hypothetical protein